jgi:three-Cys-motif partner protein
MDFTWNTLKKIASTQAFDVWYFFPFMAVNRNLFKEISDIPEQNRNRLNMVFGSDDWQTEIYRESPQLSFFKESDVEKSDSESIKNYIVKKFGEIFPTVSPEAPLLRNKNNSPQFMLCFMGSNPRPKAKDASLRIANHILSKI